MTPKRQRSESLATDVRALAGEVAGYAGRRGIFAAAFVALGALLEGVSLALLVPLLGTVTGSSAAFGRLENVATAGFRLFGIASPLGRLTLLLVFFGAVIVLRALVLYTRDATVADLQAGFVESLRLRIAALLASAPWERLARLRHARVTHVMSGDIQRAGMAAHLLLQNMVAAAMLLAQGILILLLAPILALLALGVLIAGALVVVPVIRRAHGLGTTVTGANLSLLHSTAQFLDALKLAVSQNLQEGFLVEFRQTLGELRQRQVQFMRQQTNTQLVLTSMAALAGGLLVLIGFGWFHLAPAALIVLLLVIARMSGPIGRLQQGAQQLAHALPAYKMMKDLERELAAMPRAAAAAGADILRRETSIVFDDVTFLHADSAEPVEPRGIRGISLTIAPHECLAISGPSGAGKTTFADLLVGLLPPQQGSITVGGVPLQGAALPAWRERVAYVSQDPFLFHDTIRRNLAWANPRASEADMWDALALAGAASLVRRMEHGLETVVGERGTLVSGGERQRLALARALLRKPWLLVMDEATSAIDVASERAIIGKLRALNPRPTIVVIAHRAESQAWCDRAIRIEDGRCVDVSGRGTRVVPLRAAD